jgi:hypothetical protein
MMMVMKLSGSLKPRATDPRLPMAVLLGVNRRFGSEGGLGQPTVR